MSDLYRRTYRGYLIDHHSPDPPVVTLENLSASECEEFFQTAHINQLTLYCKDHWGNSYYDTVIGHKHDGLKNRDWVAEIVPVLRKNHIEFTAYYCFEYDDLAPRVHPEWSVITSDGKPLRCGMPTNSSNAKWGIPCLRSGYRDYALGQIKEIVTRYHPDSLFIDIFGKTLCYCSRCREAFRSKYGYELPETREDMLAHNNDLVDFLDSDAENMLDDLKREIHSLDPGLALSINFSAHYPKRIRDQLDYMFTEPWAGNWLSGAYARDTAGGKPVQLGPGNVSQVYNYQPENIYELAVSEIAAQGCRVFMYSESMHRDGSLEMEEAFRVGHAYSGMEKYEKWLTDRKLIADVGIIQSDTADTLITNEPVQVRCVSRAKVSSMHRQALLGAMKLCDYAKVTWQIIPEEELNQDTAKNYRMLMLPNVYTISASLRNLLDAFVKEGGTLLVSGESGLYNDKAVRLSDYSLANLMGCHFEGIDRNYSVNTWCAYLQPTNAAIWKKLPQTTPPVDDHTLTVHTDGADVLASFVDPAVVLGDTTWVNWGNPLPGLPNGHPALLRNAYGKGAVITACFDLFTMATKEYIWPYDFFAALIDAEETFRQSVALETSEKKLLEYTCYERAERCEIIVHELSAMARLSGGDAVYVPGGVLRLNIDDRKILSAEIVYESGKKEQEVRKLKITYNQDGRAFIELPQVLIHNIIRVTYERTV